MSKKDYEAIAAILRGAHANSSPEQRIMLSSLTSSLADYFGEENEHFNRSRFLAAAKLS